MRQQQLKKIQQAAAAAASATLKFARTFCASLLLSIFFICQFAGREKKFSLSLCFAQIEPHLALSLSVQGNINKKHAPPISLSPRDKEKSQRFGRRKVIFSNNNKRPSSSAAAFLLQSVFFLLLAFRSPIQVQNCAK